MKNKKLFLAFLLLSLFFLFSCGIKENSNEEENKSIPNLTAISNFSKYTGIGIIDFQNSSASRSAATDSGYKLIGTYEDNENIGEDTITDYEVVDFVSNNGTCKQNFFIKNYRPIGDRFLFLQFTKNPSDFVMPNRNLD